MAIDAASGQANNQNPNQMNRSMELLATLADETISATLTRHAFNDFKVLNGLNVSCGFMTFTTWTVSTIWTILAVFLIFKVA